MINSFDFAVIPGSGGIYYDFGGEIGRHKAGLDFCWVDDADAPIDLNGYTLHFIASAGGKTVLKIETPAITWQASSGEIIVPLGHADTRELGKYNFIKYTLEARTGDEQDVFLVGKISTKGYANAD